MKVNRDDRAKGALCGFCFGVGRRRVAVDDLRGSFLIGGKPLRCCEGRGSLMVRVSLGESVLDGMHHNRLTMDSEDRVGWDIDPILCNHG